MKLNGCAAVQCTSRVASHNPCGVHAVNCAIQGPSATGTGSENPRAEIVDLRSSITFARVSKGVNGDAHARVTQNSATVDLQIVLWAIRFAASSWPSSSALVFLLQVRRREQLQNFQGIRNLHRQILEELRGCAARDHHNLLWGR